MRNLAQGEVTRPRTGPGIARRFRYVWDAAPGEYTLYSRATDERGGTQPGDIATPETGLEAIQDDEYSWNQGGYASNVYRDLGVDVRFE